MIRNSLTATILLAVTVAAKGYSPQPMWHPPERHNYKAAPANIRKALADARSGNPDFLYDKGTCEGSGFSKSEGVSDFAPISLGKILLLGRAGKNTMPAYLVQATRTLWLDSSQSMVRRTCSYLVAFEGNTIRSVRGTRELWYLLDAKGGSVR